MITTLLPALVSFFVLAIPLHPIHVSVTEIEFDEKDKRLEIMMRVFIDDLELALRNDLSQPELDILNPKDGVSTDQLTGDYLLKHFRVSLDGKSQKALYLGHERDGEAFTFYIEVPGVKKWKNIEVRNDIIMETYDDQSNLVHVTLGETIRSLRLTRDNPIGRIAFDGK